jgi:hypothetical protein
VTSGTIFHSRKLSIRDYLAAIAFFANGVKGVATLRLSRDMESTRRALSCCCTSSARRWARPSALMSYRAKSKSTALISVPAFARKIARPIGGGIVLNRQVVVVARERGLGRSIAWVVAREADAVQVIRENVASGSTVHADESGGWNILHASYPMLRVNHSVEFKSEEGGCTNEAESYFARLRRSEFGIHHRISGHLLQAYADEMAWREDNRRVQWKWITAAALAHPKSPVWAGYWHRSGSMTNSVTMNALVAKRAEILFKINEAEKRIEQLRTELVHLDAVLRMFRPDFKAEGLPLRHRRPTKSPYFAHGELTKRIYDAMRTNETVNSLEIAAMAMQDEGLNPNSDRATRTDFVRRVSLQLDTLERKGKLEKIGRGRAMRWRLRSSNG